MKKNLFTACIVVFICAMLTNCNKEMKEPKAANGLQSSAALHKSENACRLILTHSEFGDESFTYNENGLVDTWKIDAFGGYFKQEYNSSGRLTKSRFYQGNVLINTIVFYYEKDKVVHEIWYNGDTQEKGDEVFYTFDSKGQIVKAQSLIQDYSTTYNYTPEGNVYEWNFSLGGQHYYKAQYTFLDHNKNPDRATPGLDYAFAYINGAVSQNKWWSTSEKFTSYDAQGNPTVEYDQDPNKTVVGVGHENYVTTSNYFDVVSQSWNNFVFSYENCGPDNKNVAVSMLSPTNTNNDKFNFSKLLMHSSIKTMKEQLNQLRAKKIIIK